MKNIMKYALLSVLVASSTGLLAVTARQIGATQKAKQAIGKLLRENVGEMDSEKFTAWQSKVSGELNKLPKDAAPEYRGFVDAITQQKKVVIQNEEDVSKKIEEIETLLTGAAFTSLAAAKEMIGKVKGIIDSSVYTGVFPLGKYGEKWPYASLNAQLNGLKKQIEGMKEGKVEAMVEYDKVRAKFNEYLTWAYIGKLERIGNDSFVKGRIGKITKWLTDNNKKQFLMGWKNYTPEDRLNEMTSDITKLKTAFADMMSGGNEKLLTKDEIVGTLTDDQKTKIINAFSKYVFGLDGGEDMSIAGLIKKYITWLTEVIKSVGDKDAEKTAAENFVKNVVDPLHKLLMDFKDICELLSVDKAKFDNVINDLADKENVLEDAIVVAYQ